MSESYTLDNILYEGCPSEISDCEGGLDIKMDYITLQFTGLLDKNGVEIYEGDILSLSRCNPKEYKVGFIEGAFCLCFINGIWKNHYALDMNYIQRSLKKKSEVIGNIYQNPELVDNSH